MFLFVFNACPSEIGHADGVQSVYFVSYEMKYDEFVT